MSFQMHDKLAALLERDYAAQDALKTQFELHVCKWTHEKQTTHTKKIFLNKFHQENYTSRANFTKN